MPTPPSPTMVADPPPHSHSSPAPAPAPTPTGMTYLCSLPCPPHISPISPSGQGTSNGTGRRTDISLCAPAGAGRTKKKNLDAEIKLLFEGLHLTAAARVCARGIFPPYRERQIMRVRHARAHAARARLRVERLHTRTSTVRLASTRRGGLTNTLHWYVNVQW